MSDYGWIRTLPTCIEAEEMRKYLSDGCKGVHESVLRSYQILQKVKWLLEQGASTKVISELIQHMESSETNKCQAYNHNELNATEAGCPHCKA